MSDEEIAGGEGVSVDTQRQDYRPPRLSALECFEFSNPRQWNRWSSRWRRYRDASGLKKIPEKDQINTLIYTLGEQVEDVALSRGIREDPHNNVLAAFDGYFGLRRNTIVERAKFNRMRQGVDSMDLFINRLYRQAKYCDYKDLREELIRDQLVVGVRDDDLLEKLQAISDFTLDQASTALRRYEAVKQAQAVVREDLGDSRKSVDAVRYATKYQNDKRAQSAAGTLECARIEDNTCYGCGRQKHQGKRCPAANAKCRCCQKTGHFPVDLLKYRRR